jgi:hypothetical protein
MLIASGGGFACRHRSVGKHCVNAALNASGVEPGRSKQDRRIALIDEFVGQAE